MKPLRIGVDLRNLVFGETDGLTQWVQGTLAAAFPRDPRHTYVLFHTPFNYHLFPDPPGNVVRHTLPPHRYFDELQDRIEYEGDFDLLFRSCPDVTVLERFPLARQVVCVPDLRHEAWDGRARVVRSRSERTTGLSASPQSGGLTADEVRCRRFAFRAYQTSAGAIAASSEDVRRQLLADPWTTTGDVFLMPPGDPGSRDAAADALLAAFDRVAARVTRPRVRVSTPPTVSVVTPSFNQGRFIRQTIDSVLSQDYPHIDYRVVDGGSTDDTVAILKGYGDRVRWVSEKDRGQTHAINKGMGRATGEVLTYLNSDDLLRPGAVSRVVDHFRDRPGCDLVYGRDALIDADGNYLGMYPTADYSFDRLVECCCISQPAAFWRRRLADAVGPFDESLYLVMDYDYWLRADRAGCRLEHIPDVLANTRIHRQTKSNGGGVADSHRVRFYHELFTVSTRHAGRVGPNYLEGWFREVILNPRPWARRWEWVLRRYRPLVYRYWRSWQHLRRDCGMRPWRAAVSIAAGERRVLGPMLLRWARAAANPRGWFRRAPRPRAAVALGPDLWLGPELTVPHPGGPARLAGVPPRDTVLRVYRGAEELAAVSLPGDRPADVCVEVPPGPPGAPLRLVFADRETLPDGRAVAFKLAGTNLFGERDVA